jgi:hypothetical protein
LKSLRHRLFPSASAASLRRAAGFSFFGALLAGIFGILHDQITYTLAPEYFTQMKFDQFRAADFGFPPRIFVAEIGFLATWWVGAIAAWFLARIALEKLEYPKGKIFSALATILGVTVLFAVVGNFLAPLLLKNHEPWRDALSSLGVADTVAFHRVAGIHLGSYAGAFFGFLWKIIAWSRPHCE